MALPFDKGFDWNTLRSMTRSQLINLGMRDWDGRLLLFPASWFSHIPEGFEIKTVNKAVEKFSKRTSSDDQRWGWLAFGIEVA